MKYKRRFRITVGRFNCKTSASHRFRITQDTKTYIRQSSHIALTSFCHYRHVLRLLLNNYHLIAVTSFYSFLNYISRVSSMFKNFKSQYLLFFTWLRKSTYQLFIVSLSLYGTEGAKLMICPQVLRSPESIKAIFAIMVACVHIMLSSIYNISKTD